MGSKCITSLWICLTMLLVGVITLSILSPVWFQNDVKMLESGSGSPTTNGDEILTFGLLRYCRRRELRDVIFKCSFYDLFTNMPSVTWMISAGLFGFGVLLLLCVLLTIFSACLRRNKDVRFRMWLAYIQSVGICFLCIAILLYPIGLSSRFAREVCGNTSEVYVGGDCTIAWGYMLAIMTVSLSIFCPILAKFSIDYTADYLVNPRYSELPTQLGSLQRKFVLNEEDC